MENAKLYCQTIPENYYSGKRRIALKDIAGKEITGLVPARNKYIEVNVLEDRGDKVFVLLPKGLNKDTAWVNPNYFN